MTLDSSVKVEVEQRAERYIYYRDELKLKEEGLRERKGWDYDWMNKVCRDDGLSLAPYIKYYNSLTEQQYLNTS